MKAKLDPRHIARKIALQALFEWSFNSTDITQIINRDIQETSSFENNNSFFKTKPSSKTERGEPEKEKAILVDKDLAHFISYGVTAHLESIDKIIETCAPEWPIEQIAKVDLEILRIAIFEIFVARNTPTKVAIDEAVELAKEFGGENSSKFVNGVLATAVKNLIPEVSEKK